jgi:ABC-type multidrug transport system fused ATPase/permease subunit
LVGKDKVTFGKQTIKFYWQEIKKYKKTFVVMLISIPTATVILDTVVPYQISMVIGTLNSAGINHLFDQIIPVIILAAIGVGFNLLGYQVAAIHESAVRSCVANSAMEKLLDKDNGFFANQKAGSLTGKFIDFVNGHVAIQDLFITKMITFVINVGLGLFLIWQQTPTLALIVLVLLVGLLFQVRISRSLRSKLRQARKDLVAEANGMAADIISNNVTVKTFAAEKEELKTLKNINDRYRNAYLKDFRLMSIEGSSRILFMQAIQITLLL